MFALLHEPCHAPNPNTKERKGLITSYKTYGITSLKKHGDANHTLIVQKIEEEVNPPLKRTFEKQLAKKMLNVLSNALLTFLLLKILSKMMMCSKKIFCKTLGF
jgi:hypothetical protein